MINPIEHLGYSSPPEFDTAIQELINKGISNYIKNEAQTIMDKAERYFNQRLLVRQAIMNAMNGQEPFTNYNDMIDKQLSLSSTKSDTVFITVNVRPEITFQELEKLINKLMKKKSLVSIYGCYEIRSKVNDIYTGLHTHMIVKYTGRPGNFERCLKTIFKNVCDVNNNHCLNIKYIESEIIESKIKYIQGDKQDSKKESIKLCNSWKPERWYEKARSSLLVGPALIDN